MPIVCTGNDFSTLYAPLIRDGRMEKFYWAPTREDRIGVAVGIFQVPSPPACPTTHFAALLACSTSLESIDLGEAQQEGAY